VRQEGEPVGRIRLMTAAADLAPIGDGVYQSAGASPATGARLQTSALEGSNVDTLRELTRMMDAVRAFEMSQKIALTDTEVRRKLTDEVGRTR
jgi:flagellar basal-body rod protein FlgF